MISHQDGDFSALISEKSVVSTAGAKGALLSQRKVGSNMKGIQRSVNYFAPRLPSIQNQTLQTLENVCHGQDAFVCPYWKGQQSIKTEHAWRRHVFSDLKAYVCTAKACELRMFRSSEVWMQHQLSEHFAFWSCPICRGRHPFFSVQLFRAHVRLGHSTGFSEEQLLQLTTSSKHDPHWIRASECQFCDWTMIIKGIEGPNFRTSDLYVTPKQYLDHVCLHLEQLSLLVFATASAGRLHEKEAEILLQENSAAMTPEIAYEPVAEEPRSSDNTEAVYGTPFQQFKPLSSDESARRDPYLDIKRKKNGPAISHSPRIDKLASHRDTIQREGSPLKEPPEFLFTTPRGSLSQRTNYMNVRPVIWRKKKLAALVVEDQTHWKTVRLIA